MTTMLDALIGALMPPGAAPGPGSAVVVDVAGDGTVTLTIAGAAVPGQPCLDSYTDRVPGDVVLALPTRGGRYVVLGRLGHDDAGTAGAIPDPPD